jgi:hypothetical protein
VGGSVAMVNGVVLWRGGCRAMVSFQVDIRYRDSGEI